MPDPVLFSPADHLVMREMRSGGATWDQVAVRLGCSRDRAMKEAVSIGVSTGLVVSAEPKSAPRGIQGGEGLPAWHPICRAVLGEAGLPVPADGEVW